MCCIAGSQAMAGLGGAELRAAGAGGGAGRARGPVGAVAARLAAARGCPLAPARHDWLTLTPKDRMPAPHHVAFPKPPKAPGTYRTLHTASPDQTTKGQPFTGTISQ